MIVTRRSAFTGKIHSLDLPVTQEQLVSYYHGGQLIQQAFPDLTPAQREFIKTGVTEEEWNATFGSQP